MADLSRKNLEELDRDDPLAPFRDEFVLPEGVIYLDGNSLGPLPRAVSERVAKVVDEEWAKGLIRSWNSNDWINLSARVGAKIAPLIGAGADEVIALDTTTVNIFKLVAAALKLRPGRKVIVSEQGNFPSDLYVMEGLIGLLDDGYELRLAEPGKLAQAIDGEVALVEATHVDFKTGEVHDMAGLTQIAHEQGALMLWDLCHTAGAMPVDVNGADADFAVGCGYKFLNGGPGAPAFVYVARRHQDEVRQPLSGWLGHAEPFAFEASYRPAAGMARMICGTPSVIAMSALDEALDVFARADMSRIREKSCHLGDLFLRLVAERCGGHGFAAACPEDGRQRGSQVSIRHDEAYPIMQALIARGVIGDFRAPDNLRFGMTPLYTRYADIWEAVEILRQIMESAAWDRPELRLRATVT